jgi:putative transposase
LHRGELTDAQWAVIAPVLPPAQAIGRRRTTDLRRVVSAIQHHWRTGCPWRKLPAEFQPWNTAYGYFRAWCHDGTLRKLRPLLSSPKSLNEPRDLPSERSLPPKLNPLRDASR